MGMSPAFYIKLAKERGWKFTAIELVDAGQAFGYESPDKKRFLTTGQLIEEMQQEPKP